MADYRENVKITVDKEIALTVADLNKTLIVTDDKNIDFGYYTTLEEIEKKFGNNTKIYKAVSQFLSQTDSSGNILQPDFFSVLGIAKEEEEEEPAYRARVVSAISEVINESWYALTTLMDSAELIEELRAIVTANRKIYIAETASYPFTNADKIKSERVLAIYNPATSGDSREYKAISYAGAVVTPGAGSKCNLVKLAGVTADTTGGKKQELTKINITFVEKMTSEGYIVANGGKALDGTYIDETTALDCTIVNINENLLKMLILKGFTQDEEGYALVESTLTSVMEELGKKNIIAKENGRYEYKIVPITQTKEERMQRLLRPQVIFRLKGWAYFIDLTLKVTNDVVNKSS